VSHRSKERSERDRRVRDSELVESENERDGERIELARNLGEIDGEANVRYYITFELAIGGELFDRITQRGRFTEKDAVECIRYVPLLPGIILVRLDVPPGVKRQQEDVLTGIYVD
jgi:hypothetical protein